MFTNRPAVKFLAPFVVGILIGWQWSIPLWVTGAAMSLIVLGLVAFTPWKTGRRASHSSLLTLCLIVALGILKVTFDARVVPTDNVERFISPKIEVELSGTISEYPKSNGQVIQVVIDAKNILEGGRIFGTSGGVVTSIRMQDIDSAARDSLTYGRDIFLRGKLVGLAGPRNPGDADLRQYYQAGNIWARFYHNRLTRIRLGPVRENLLSMMVYPVRKSMAGRFERFVGGQEAAFLKGLIIGDRNEIQPDLKEAFVNAGVMHIIAVAGLHVGLVSVVFLSVLAALRIPKRMQLLSLAVVLVFFVFLTGSAHPVVRAVIMALVMIGGTFLERRTDVYNSLAAAAIILLLLDARNLFQAGFQLSFSSVFFIVYLHPRCTALFRSLPKSARELPILKFVLDLVVVSFSAAVGTLPFMSLYFGKISVIGLLANIIVVPVTGIVLALGLTTIAASCISVWICSVYAATTKLVAHFLLKVISFFGGLSFAYIDSHFSFWSTIAFYSFVIMAANIQNKDLVRRFIVLLLVVANVAMYGSINRGNGENEKLKVYFLDVGQGDAIYIEFPNGKNLIVDAGPRTSTTDAGSRFIAPFLKSQGVHRLNTLVMSHPDGDHIGGMPYLMRHFAVDRIVDGGSYSNSNLSKECLHLIDSLRIGHDVDTAGRIIAGCGNVRLYILNPPNVLVREDTTVTVSFNNQSVVLKLLYGQTGLLLTGDAEVPAEERMIQTYNGFLGANILKAGHHGSITSSSPDFLNTVRPQLAIISVGLNNKFGHPSQQVLDRLKTMHCEYERTDEAGAVLLESDGIHWQMVPWH